MLDQRQHSMLDAMGIQLWSRRQQHQPGDIVDVTQPDEAEEQLHDWESLQQAVETCHRCGLAATRTQTVFGAGNQHAELMIIGEAPGADEDRQGEPFVGRAGQLLNQMLLACGFSREQVYIANILKCRPQGNRNPSPEEMISCRHYLNRQIELVAPKLLLAVGGVAATSLLDSDKPVGQLRGELYHYGGQKVPMIVTYHPAYLLRQPSEKRKSWEDLQFAMRKLGDLS
ncbi:uracil-DNA glycosylase [Solemya velum gill symbiont]|uniref:uracil-DNA glycosylase n=1 Tax=Solemya velum gill symbiont TaxID=2340 RepID=UPI0015C2F252|nr:uracil-DNA glycosylase [Solemya velum gill symbiont]